MRVPKHAYLPNHRPVPILDVYFYPRLCRRDDNNRIRRALPSALDRADGESLHRGVARRTLSGTKEQEMGEGWQRGSI